MSEIARTIDLLEKQRDDWKNEMARMGPEDSRRYYADRTLKQFEDQIERVRAQQIAAGGR